MHGMGNGVPQDLTKAARLFKLAADQGDAKAITTPPSSSTINFSHPALRSSCLVSKRQRSTVSVVRWWGAKLLFGGWLCWLMATQKPKDIRSRTWDNNNKCNEIQKSKKEKREKRKGTLHVHVQESGCGWCREACCCREGVVAEVVGQLQQYQQHSRMLWLLLGAAVGAVSTAGQKLIPQHQHQHQHRHQHQHQHRYQLMLPPPLVVVGCCCRREAQKEN